MTRKFAPLLIILVGAIALVSPPLASAQLISVQVKPTEPEEEEEGETNDLVVTTERLEEEIISEAPSDTVAPSSEVTTSDNTDDDAGSDNTGGCDPMEQAFAPDCCPMIDPMFATFCASLMERSHYSSTGMLEAHEPWIGGYGIASSKPNNNERRN